MRRVEEDAIRSAGTPRRGEAIVIASGKGGVGKTNLAVNLGVQLAQRGCDVVLIDGDLGLANADILLDLSPIGDLTDVLNGSAPAAALLALGPAGLRVLCGSARADLPALRVDDCQALVAQLRRECDLLLVDCGAGISAAVLGFALACDRLVLVTTPEPTAIADAYATLKLLTQRGFGGRAQLVVNMSDGRREAEAVARRLRRVAAQFLGLSLEWLGSVAFDRHVSLAIRARTPVVLRYPSCPASLCLEALSRQFLPPPASATDSGLWTRVAGLFL